MQYINPPEYSLLLLDDSPDLVRCYKEHLEAVGCFRVTTALTGEEAKSYAEAQLFDFVIIDAKLDYKGLEFGGIRLADDLRPRYGTGSILIISRFITNALLSNYGASYEFLEKTSASTTTSFCEDLKARLELMRSRQFVFVAMPFSEQYLGLYTTSIRPAVLASGFNCVRIDEINHTRRIQEVIFEYVFSAKAVIFLADGQNPNAFYEAGFADAMRKEVIVVAKESSSLPFDIANKNSVFYHSAPDGLLVSILNKIQGLRLTSTFLGK